MKRGEFGVVLCSLEDPHVEECIAGVICDASWAGARQTREFYQKLLKSLDHKGSSKRSLERNGSSKKILGQESTSMHVPALDDVIIFEWGSEKLHDEEYNTGFEALVQDLTWTLDEGVMITKSIQTQDNPKFHDLVKPGGKATTKTVLK